tara:strand:+ start:384 stop:1274 length:891 start_codon:yes stop_codon:yes gene_type:complete
MKKRKSLGRGLSAILGNISVKSEKETNQKNINNGDIYTIPISQIEINPFQPRNTFKQEKLNELAASISNLGIIQPITVRKIDTEKYQLISGERRYRASKIARINHIPAFIRIANDQQMLEMALVENIQRENLNPIEIALSYKRLIKECNLTQEECSYRVGKNRTTVTNFLRLLKLPVIIQKGLQKNKITTGHARALINIESEENKINIYYDIIQNGYSVREVEQLSKTFNNIKYKRLSKEKKQNAYSFNQKRIIYDLSTKLNTEIEMKQNKNESGRIIICFKNQKDLKRIYDVIKK